MGVGDAKGEGGEVEVKAKRLAEVTANFEAWYALYPKHVARKDAEAAFRVLMRGGADLSVLMSATKEYIRLNQDTDPRYIKHPASFLRNERWRDYAPSKNGSPVHPLSDEEKQSILDKFKSGEYTEEIVRKIETKYATRIIE